MIVEVLTMQIVACVALTHFKFLPGATLHNNSGYFIKIYYVMCVEGVVSSADLLSGMKRKQSFLVQSTKEKVAAFPRGS